MSARYARRRGLSRTCLTWEGSRPRCPRTRSTRSLTAYRAATRSACRQRKAPRDRADFQPDARRTACGSDVHICPPIFRSNAPSPQGVDQGTLCGATYGVANRNSGSGFREVLGAVILARDGAIDKSLYRVAELITRLTPRHAIASASVDDGQRLRGRAIQTIGMSRVRPGQATLIVAHTTRLALSISGTRCDTLIMCVDATRNVIIYEGRVAFRPVTQSTCRCEF